MRKPLFLWLGLVGAAMLFLAIAKGLRGSMLPPCPTWGHDRKRGNDRGSGVLGRINWRCCAAHPSAWVPYPWRDIESTIGRR